MSKRASPRLVGGFVIGAVALAVAAILLFGSGKLLRPKYSHVVFFEGSVMGLNIGAPVSFRGVQVGEVTEITAVARGLGADEIIFIEVIVDIFDDVVRSDTLIAPGADYYEVIESMIQKGMRARLETQSMITGQRYVSLDFYEDEPLIRKGLQPDYHEMPAIPTSTQELKRTLDRTLAKLEEIPIGDILEELEGVLTGLDRIVNSAELMETLGSMNEGMLAFKSTVETLEESITAMTGDLDDSAGEVRRTLVEARNALGAIQDLAAEGKVVHYETLENLNDTLDSIRYLVQYLEQHPEALLTGKGDKAK